MAAVAPQFALVDCNNFFVSCERVYGELVFMRSKSFLGEDCQGTGVAR
jgi:hypothetical protein